MSFNIPLLSNHLDSKGFSPMFIGYSMASVSIAYLLMMPFTFKLMKTMSRRGVIFMGLCLITNGMMITGLDHVYDF
jgi:MFS family permease